MEIINFRRHFSGNTLLRMLVLAILVGVLIVWKQDLVRDFYFKNQLTDVGLVINGAILALFLVGLVKMIVTFAYYMREEAAINRFLRNQEKDAEPLKGIAQRSIIARRFHAMQRLHDNNTPINQNALASTLVASESTKTSLPRFINNTLILTGVFGTIVALSIALVGASDLLENAVDTGGMGMVVHGMSTALSTTITAILCYLFFGYFYLKLADAQTNLLSAVEQATTAYILPRFQIETDSVLYEFTGLIRSLQTLVDQMERSQEKMQEVEGAMLSTMQSYEQRIGGFGEELGEIRGLLRKGFRLREED